MTSTMHSSGCWCFDWFVPESSSVNGRKHQSEFLLYLEILKNVCSKHCLTKRAFLGSKAIFFSFLINITFIFLPFDELNGFQIVALINPQGRGPKKSLAYSTNLIADGSSGLCKWEFEKKSGNKGKEPNIPCRYIICNFKHNGKLISVKNQFVSVWGMEQCGCWS